MNFIVKFRFFHKSESGSKYCTLLGFVISDDNSTCIIYLPGIMVGFNRQVK
jgi:hypothetical protein